MPNNIELLDIFVSVSIFVGGYVIAILSSWIKVKNELTFMQGQLGQLVNMLQDIEECRKDVSIQGKTLEFLQFQITNLKEQFLAGKH